MWTLILLKAFYEVWGRAYPQGIWVARIANGLFIESDGDFEKTQEGGPDQSKMQEYVAAQIPIMKRNVTTDEAIEIFRRHRCMRKSVCSITAEYPRVNLYSIGGLKIITMAIWCRTLAI